MNSSPLLDVAAVQGPAFGWLVLHALGMFFLLRFLVGLITRTPISQKAPQWVITDMFYWALAPVFRMLSRVVVAGAVLLAAFALQRDPGLELLQGFGPLAEQHPALMFIEVLLLQDFTSYWLHRLFHRVPWLWRVHAIHHSATEVDWSTTGRVHPINEVANYAAGILPCLLLGFPLSAALMTVPVAAWYAISAHAAWDPPLGRLYHLLAGPRFHRWHHTKQAEGGDKNFGNVFSIWDRLFGTYYLPAGRKPTVFGLDTDPVPPTYLGQLAYPFRGAEEQRGARVPRPRETNPVGSPTSPSRA